MRNKLTIEREVDVVIIGAGFAGLYLSYLLRQSDYNRFVIVAPTTNTPSNKSYYQFRTRGMRQSSLRKTMLDSGRMKNNRQLVSVLVGNIDDEITNLSHIVSLKPSYVGVTPVRPRELLDLITRESESNRIIGEVTQVTRGRGCFYVRTTENNSICAKSIVFCSGGARARFYQGFKDEKTIHNPFDIASSLSCRVKDIEKVMIHPFYSRGVCIPTDNLFGYTIIGKNNAPLPFTNSLIRSHNAHFHFKEILEEMKSVPGPHFALKGAVKLPLNPTVHYVLGGIVINKHGKTNIKNVYALGECAYGMHGDERVGGCSLSEILVMARIIRDQIIKG